MTADELLERASSRLLTEYSLLLDLHAEEAQARHEGITPEELAARREADTGPDDEDEDDGDTPDDDT